MTEALPFFDDSEIQRVLCVAAHPDDLEYGASAAVARWTARGSHVSYLLLTAGEAGMPRTDPHDAAVLRAQEQRAACAAVGVDDLVILDFPDGTLEPSLEVRQAIARRIRQLQPEVVLTPTWELEVGWGLNHADHRAAGIAVVDAVRDADNPWVFPELAEEEDLQPWGVSWLLSVGAGTDHLIDITGEPFEAGVASLEAHREYFAELGGDFDPREMLDSMTGVAAGRTDHPHLTHALAVAVHRMG